MSLMQMELDNAINMLVGYSRRHSGPKAQFAAVAAKYLGLRKEFGRVYEGMLSDPLLQEILEEAATATACVDDSGFHTIYCDGCCLGNGREGAVAGYGICVVDGRGVSLQSESFRVPYGDPQTNQRAELLALRYALTIVAENPHICYKIYTDSRYGMDCITKWSMSWEENGWRRADGKPVLHADIIKDCVTMYKVAAESRRVSLHHIASHTGASDPHSRGNAEADRLARLGAELTSS